MMHTKLCNAVVLVAASLGVTMGTSDEARAELVMVDAIEMRAHRADVVVIGTVYDIADKVAPGTSNRPGVKYREVAIATKRMLKGKAIKVVRYITYQDPRSTLADGQRIIAFLDEADRRKDLVGQPHLKGRLVPSRMNAYHSEAVMNLAKLPAPGVPSRDFTMLTDEASIVGAIRAAFSAKGLKPGQVNLDAPLNSALYRSYYSGSAVMVTVPLDALTEASAIALLAHKHVWERTEGIKVLSHFKSTANIARLKGLLKDTGTATRTANGLKKVVFLAREAAYKTLVSWGVNIKKPPLTK